MTDKPETQSEVSPRDAQFWLDEISAAQVRLANWYTRADEADERYRDEDGDSGFGGLNILWANVETQKAAIGEDFGKPQVMRINMPEADGGIARHVATVWERSIDAAVKDSDDNHDIALAAGDVFLPGRGQVWIEVEADERKWVSVSICRVCHRDYLEGYHTRWRGVPWVARRHFFTRDELASECRMSQVCAEKVPMSETLPYTDKGTVSDSAGKEQFKRAEVWEIWSKFPEKARIYVATGHKDGVLRYDPDPLSLRGFFPCPRPMQANGDEAKPPLTDYSRYQGQAEELDRISERIYVLTDTLRRRGVCDSSIEELKDLATSEDNILIPVTNWAVLQQKGGLDRVIDWEDILPTAQILAELHKQRDSLLKLIYELSGISDLARGHTDPDETATAQNLKASFGSSRFKRREKESRRFAAEAYAIKGEVIAELFPREQLEQMTGISMPRRVDIESARARFAELQADHQQAQQLAQQTGAPPPQVDQNEVNRLAQLARTRFSWEDVSGVLRSDVRRCYSVEIDTDQTAFQDQEADKLARTQLFAAIMQALQQIAPMIAGNPKNGEVFKQLVMFVITAFKAGRGLEEGIESAIDAAIEQAAQQGQQQTQQDPKAMADAQVAQAKMQLAQIQLQTAQIGLQKAQADAQQAGSDIQLEGLRAQQKAQQEAAKTQAIADQTEAKRQAHLVDIQNKAEKLEFDRATRSTAQEALVLGPTRAPARNGV